MDETKQTPCLCVGYPKTNYFYTNAVPKLFFLVLCFLSCGETKISLKLFPFWSTFFINIEGPGTFNLWERVLKSCVRFGGLRAWGCSYNYLFVFSHSQCMLPICHFVELTFEIKFCWLVFESSQVIIASWDMLYAKLHKID